MKDGTTKNVLYVEFLCSLVRVPEVKGLQACSLSIRLGGQDGEEIGLIASEGSIIRLNRHLARIWAIAVLMKEGG